MPHFIFSKDFSIPFSDGKGDAKVSVCSFSFDDYHPDAVHHVVMNFSLTNERWTENDVCDYVFQLRRTDKSNRTYMVASSPNTVFFGSDTHLANLCKKFTDSIWECSRYDQWSVRTILHTLLTFVQEGRVGQNALDLYVKTHETRWSAGKLTFIPPEENTPAVRSTLWIAANHPKRTMNLGEIYEQEKALMDVHGA